MDLPKKSVAHQIPNAVLDGDFEFLENLIYSNKEVVNSIGPGGYSALHVAVYKEDRKMIDMLKSYGANGKVLTANGDSCGHIACRIGSINMLNEFISYLDDVDLKNYNNETMQDICETIPSEAEAYQSMYGYQEWNNDDPNSHRILSDTLRKNRLLCRDIITHYRIKNYHKKRRNLISSYIKNANKRLLNAKVFRNAGGAMERRFTSRQEVPLQSPALVLEKKANANANSFMKIIQDDTIIYDNNKEEEPFSEGWTQEDLNFFNDPKHRDDVTEATAAALAGDFISRSNETAIKTLAPNPK